MMKAISVIVAFLSIETLLGLAMVSLGCDGPFHRERGPIYSSEWRSCIDACGGEFEVNNVRARGFLGSDGITCTCNGERAFEIKRYPEIEVQP